jgi:uracil-DNA glycosylase
VKHFKFEPRGKRRLHKRPNTYEIERCKWWNNIERALIKPELVVALGATAARSLIGKTVTITIHPSSLLRIRDSEDKKRQYVDWSTICVSARAFCAPLETINAGQEVKPPNP